MPRQILATWGSLQSGDIRAARPLPQAPLLTTPSSSVRVSPETYFLRAAKTLTNRSRLYRWTMIQGRLAARA